MPMTINTNVVSLNAQRNLGTSQMSLATSMQRASLRTIMTRAIEFMAAGIQTACGDCAESNTAPRRSRQR